MLSRLKYAALIAASLSLTAACSRPPRMNSADATFGDAVNNNMVVQVTDPEPQPEAGPPPFNGRRAAIAMERYETEKVKEPASLSVSGLNVYSTGGND